MGDGREFKILITGDAAPLTQSSQQGAAALKDLGKTGEEAHKDIADSTEKATGQSKLLHAAAKLLSHEFSLLHGLGRYLFNPWTAALGAVLVAVRMVVAAHERLRQAAEEAGTSNARAFLAVSDAHAEIAGKQEEFISKFKEEFDGLARAQDNAVVGTNKVIQAIHDQEQALQSLMESRKQFELSQAKDDAEKQRIESKYRVGGRDLKLNAESDVIGAKQKQLADAEARQAGLTAATASALAGVSGDEGFNRAGKIALDKEIIDKVKKDIEEGEKKSEIYKGTSKWDSAAKKLSQDKEYLAELQTHMTGLSGEDASAKARLDEARKAELENQKIIQERRAEIPTMQVQFGLHAATAGAQTAYEGASSVAGEFGRSATQLSKSAGVGDISGFISALGAMAIWPARMKEMSQAIKAADQGMNDAIKDLQKQVQALQRDRQAPHL